MKTAALIRLKAREATIKRRLRAHLKQLGFHRAQDGTLLPPQLDKDAYRRIHVHQRTDKHEKNSSWLNRNAAVLGRHLASGTDVDVRAIRPRLELIAGGTWQSDLFRFAGFFWRIPISEGYGRRLRFLVWDDSNDKLIGLLALGDAVFNLRVRDELIGWNHERRAQSLVNLMDAYVLGAVPPYNMLLGAKLIATLASTSDVIDAFDAKYRSSVGVISKARKNARLAAITTTSALGRSSIYNRLKLDGRLIFRPIGYTSGWGHFHISESLFQEMRDFLTDRGDAYADASKFGQGPNWRLRVIRRSLSCLGMDPDLIRHGFAREVYICPLGSNSFEFLRGDHKRLRYADLPTVRTAGEQALNRWVIPRASRNTEYLAWRSERFVEELSAVARDTIKDSGSTRWNGQKTS